MTSSIDQSPSPIISPASTSPPALSQPGQVTTSSNPSASPSGNTHLPSRSHSHTQSVSPIERIHNESRRPSSITFSVERSEALLRSSSNRSLPSGARVSRRLSSPPPPTRYKPRVAFDTFQNRDAPHLSITLSHSHSNYVQTRRSRTWVCGLDENNYSEFALGWLFEELVEDSDQVVCLRAVRTDSKTVTDSKGVTDLEQARYRREAAELLELVKSKNTEDKSVSIVLELAIGSPQDVIERSIKTYEPAALIVGTRGRSLGGLQGLMPGSVSKWCLQQSPVPVIVVRPQSSRTKKKQKRQKDPNRKSYSTMMKQGTRQGESSSNGSLTDQTSVIQTCSNLTLSADEEALEVAKAIGLSQQYMGVEFDDVQEKKSEEHKREMDSLREKNREEGLALRRMQSQNIESGFENESPESAEGHSADAPPELEFRLGSPVVSPEASDDEGQGEISMKALSKIHVRPVQSLSKEESPSSDDEKSNDPQTPVIIPQNADVLGGVRDPNKAKKEVESKTDECQFEL